MPPQSSEFDQLGSGGRYGRSPFVDVATGQQDLGSLAPRTRYSGIAAALADFGRSAIEAGKFPGNLLAGKYVTQQANPNVLTDREINQAISTQAGIESAAPAMALSMLGGSRMLPGASTRTTNQAGMFAPGEVLDRIHGTNNTQLAAEMAKEGATRQQIWEGTGRFADPKGRLLGEISDYGAQLQATEPGLYKYGDVVSHPELYSAFPGMKRISTEIMPLVRNEAYGSYSRPPGEGIFLAERAPNMMLSTAAHEGQHAVAFRTGMEPGASIKGFENLSAPVQNYLSQWGEMLPRIAQERLGMQPWWLKKNPPFASDVVQQFPYTTARFDIPPKAQNVRPILPRGEPLSAVEVMTILKELRK